jgi:DNA-binding GntR family transcriptional regulator
MTLSVSVTDTEEDPDISRAEHAYRRLLDGIRAGEFRPGQRLREIDLATRLKVSRTPVREAIRRLASEGLVELAPGRGVMIIELSRQQVRELYFLRGTLEGAAARLAAQHASESEIASFRQTLAEIARVEEDPMLVARLNRDFHRQIHDAAHNRYLARALSQLSDSLALLPGTTFQAAGRPKLAQAEHAAMVEAIERRDPDRAEALTRDHIERASTTRVSMMFAER